MQDTDDLMNDIRKSPNIYIKEYASKLRRHLELQTDITRGETLHRIL